MMIITKRRKEGRGILYLKRVKQLVTTYPPLGSGQNSKKKMDMDIGMNLAPGIRRGIRV